MKTLAFDKAVSFRWHDADGRLHVDKSNLTRVQVAPYYGREIPDYEKLGLDPEKIYQGYRPAEELGMPKRLSPLSAFRFSLIITLTTRMIRQQIHGWAAPVTRQSLTERIFQTVCTFRMKTPYVALKTAV